MLVSRVVGVFVWKKEDIKRGHPRSYKRILKLRSCPAHRAGNYTPQINSKVRCPFSLVRARSEENSLKCPYKS